MRNSKEKSEPQPNSEKQPKYKWVISDRMVRPDLVLQQMQYCMLGVTKAMKRAIEQSGVQPAQEEEPEKEPKYLSVIYDRIVRPDTPEGMRYPKFVIKSGDDVCLVYLRDGRKAGDDSSFWYEVVRSTTFKRPLRGLARSKMIKHAIRQFIGVPEDKKIGRPSPLYRNARILAHMDGFRIKGLTRDAPMVLSGSHARPLFYGFF